MAESSSFVNAPNRNFPAREVYFTRNIKRRNYRAIENLRRQLDANKPLLKLKEPEPKPCTFFNLPPDPRFKKFQCLQYPKQSSRGYTYSSNAGGSGLRARPRLECLTRQCGQDLPMMWNYTRDFFAHQIASCTDPLNPHRCYDLTKNETVGKIVLDLARINQNEYVYEIDFSYVDLAVDENGLWAIYRTAGEPYTLLVSKLEPDELRIEKTWNVTLPQTDYGNGFIVCGVLYLVQNVSVEQTTFSFAYDLYEKEVIDLDTSSIRFLNPFKMNVMIAYNPSDQRIYSWDRGNQLVYPLLIKYDIPPRTTTTTTSTTTEE